MQALFSRGWFLGLLWTAAAFAAPVEHVVILSLDGGRPDVLLSAETPNLHEMADRGAWTWWAQTVNPSITLVSHSSMLTGCLPQKHGIHWNKWAPERGYAKATTCFEVAKAAGLRTAMVVAKRKFEHLAKPGSVDRFLCVEDEAPVVAEAAARVIREDKPHLLFVHFKDGDSVGHAKGWGSREQRQAFEKCDEGVGVLRSAIRDAGLQSSTLFVISADHGGHGKTHGTTDVRDMTIPWIAYAPGLVPPHQVESSVSTCDTAATAVAVLGLKPDPSWDGKPVDVLFESPKP
ncbi:MAG: alkaline phosphatase family protein [Verrucomicrobiae bacterium]|nr:alkaline phosphatase family protein [Verrucomicrobiae bacterium]